MVHRHLFLVWESCNFKLNILPRIFYILQTIPIKIPPAFFLSYRRECTSFLWGKSWPRLNHNSLTVPKLKRGIDLPDIKKYYLAYQLTRAVDWNIHSQIHKGSINVSTQENGYKISSRWYRTPLRIHKFTPSISPNCWWCNEELGLLLHIWWACPLTQTFWEEVLHRLTCKISTLPLDYSPAQLLLHHSSIPISDYFHSLAVHLINMAKLCIPFHLRSQDPLTNTNKITDMEEP